MSKSSRNRSRRKGSQNAGRPRQDGARYPSGKLKPVGPNQLVVGRRRAICNDVTMASCPLDAALSNGWISTSDHRAGTTFAMLYRASGLGGPAMGASDYREANTTNMEIDPATAAKLSGGKNWLQHLTDGEITAMWDEAFRDHRPTGADAEQRAAEALTKWRDVNAAMPAEVRAEMHLVCVQESWPQWIPQRAAGKMDTSWERKRDLLLQGFQTVRGLFRRPADEEVSCEAEHDRVARGVGPKVAETTHYVDADGVLQYEAVRLRRAGA